MPSVDELVVAIRDRINYEEVFGEFLRMRGRGDERMAFCVFHENTHSEALSVNVRDGLYHCHNPACNARGDIFDFYRRIRSLTFTETVHELARRLGLEHAGEVHPRSYGAPSRAAALTANSEDVLASYSAAINAGEAVPTHASGTGSGENGNGAAPAGAPRRNTPDEERRTISDAIPQSYHDRLNATPAFIEYLTDTRGLSPETIEKYQIGHDGRRYTIPVRDVDGVCVNIRRYDKDARDSHDKMISWRTGFGEARLYPLTELEAEGCIYILEGEWDTLVARQHGLNAITVTTGAGTWADRFNQYVRGREVVVCYDVDDAGRAGSLNVAHEIHGIATSVKVVTLPLAQEGADISDYFVRYGHSKDDFLALVAQTPIYAPSERDATAITDREPIPVHLSLASEAKYYNTNIQTRVMLSGKTTAPYLVPKQVKLSCRMPGLKMCERCPVAKKAGTLNHSIEFVSNEILQFINVSDATLSKQIKSKVGIPSKCTFVDQSVMDAMNIEEVQIIPEVERGTESEAPYVTRAAFYLGHGLQANRSYVMNAVTVPEPKRQLATHLIYDAIPSQSNIDAFRLTDTIVERLKEYQPKHPGVQGLWSHLDTIYDDLEGVTRIYQRRDLMLAVDLTYHSLIGFRFQGEQIPRGWVEALIVGDSRTGKTSIVRRLMDHYGAGEFTTGENTSFAGLVGGLHQVGSSWALQWGRWPLNDRRLLTIDEAGNLGIEQIGRMSSMRSSGIAEVIKVHTERTMARTRAIWISNPRGNKPLSFYSQGVLAIKELIGAPEDIARFDLVLTASSSDVPLGVVNRERAPHPPQIFTDELSHQRVMWAWSRTSDHVVWADGTAQKVLECAMEHGNTYRYGTEIPLVEPNEQRIKLARLAVSAAVMFFSTDELGQNVIVRPEHVEFVFQFLNTIYSKPSLSFTEYALGMRRRYELNDEERVARIIRTQEGAARAMLEQEGFSLRDLQEILGIDDRAVLRDAAWTLRNLGFLRKGLNNNYVKTPAAIRWLRTEIARGGSEATGDGFSRLVGDDPPHHNGRGSPIERDDEEEPDW